MQINIQKRYYIVTDLKKEYREVIYKLGFKHQFCKFHTKQKINRDLRTYLKQNKIKEEDKSKIIEFKKIIFNIIDSKNIDEAKNIRKQLFSKINEFPHFTRNLFWKFIVPYFKNLTYFLEKNYRNFNIQIKSKISSKKYFQNI